MLVRGSAKVTSALGGEIFMPGKSISRFGKLIGAVPTIHLGIIIIF